MARSRATILSDGLSLEAVGSVQRHRVGDFTELHGTAVAMAHIPDTIDFPRRGLGREGLKVCLWDKAT